MCQDGFRDLFDSTADGLAIIIELRADGWCDSVILALRNIAPRGKSLKARPLTPKLRIYCR